MFLRITPAWAGKSIVYDLPIKQEEDHPRVGGEKRFIRFPSAHCPGSPPRGRGKGIQRVVLFITRRITPAWAGKSRFLLLLLSEPKDHPRVGGEKHTLLLRLQQVIGSPPRGRGKVSERLTGANYARITPAWAGKRLKRSHRSGIFISGPIPFHSVLHRPAGSGGSRAGRDGSLAGQPQNAGPA